MFRAEGCLGSRLGASGGGGGSGGCGGRVGRRLVFGRFFVEGVAAAIEPVVVLLVGKEERVALVV